MIMIQKELEDLLKAQGWTPIKRSRYHQEYWYASKRRGEKLVEVYITADSKLDQTTEQKVLAKLQKSMNKN
jgi:hypothetical protein